MVGIAYKWYRFKWWLAKYLVPSKPLHLDIEITSVCNLKCVFCPQSDKKKTFALGIMKFDMFKKIIDQAVELKVPSIKLNLRGEATTHPDFFKFCDYIRGKFIDIRLNTNGNYSIVLNGIIQKTFNHVIFSVDALHPKTYASIRTRGIMKNLITNISLLHKFFTVKLLSLSYVITNTNRNELKEFKEYWKKQSGIKLFVRHAAERTEGDYSCGDQVAIGRKDCLMPRRRLTILHDGLVIPCCVSAWNENTMVALGNVKKDRIIDIWDCSLTNKVRDKLKDGTAFDDYKMCEECFSRESFVWENTNG